MCVDLRAPEFNRKIEQARFGDPAEMPIRYAHRLRQSHGRERYRSQKTDCQVITALKNRRQMLL